MVRILVILFALCVASCTNNGDIGALYGLWAMDGCAADGEAVDEEVYGDFYWRFQGELVAINQMTGVHDHLEWMGMFVHAGQELDLDFSEGEVDTDFYPSQIGLIPGKMQMDMLQLNGSTLQLRYQALTGITWLYTLRKLK